VIYVIKIKALSGMALVAATSSRVYLFRHPSHQILYKAKVSQKNKTIVETFDYLASRK
jgi:hypothetical protein